MLTVNLFDHAVKVLVDLSEHEPGGMSGAIRSVLMPYPGAAGAYNHGAYPHPDRQGLCVCADLQLHSLHYGSAFGACDSDCHPGAGIDLNLAAQQLQAPPGLLLSTSTHLGSGHKRQRTDDDADPSGTVHSRQHLARKPLLPACMNVRQLMPSHKDQSYFITTA